MKKSNKSNIQSATQKLPSASINLSKHFTKKSNKSTYKNTNQKTHKALSQSLVPQSLPPAHRDLLNAYLVEVRKYPLLTAQEEKRLAIKYFEEGDADAASSLVKANLRFVIKIAAEYLRFGSKLIDLIQEGNIGLMHAVREYNPYKGVRLTSYAVWWIRGYIKEYLLKNYSPIKIATTSSQRKIFYNLQKEIKKLESEGFQPTTKLLSQRLDVPEKDVKTMQVRMASKPISLDELLDRKGGSQTRLIDLDSSLEDSMDSSLALKENLALLSDRIDKTRPLLNEKELYILDKRLLADQSLTLKEVGDVYGITRERVRQIEHRLIQKLRQSFNK